MCPMRLPFRKSFKKLPGGRLGDIRWLPIKNPIDMRQVPYWSVFVDYQLCNWLEVRLTRVLPREFVREQLHHAGKR